MKTRIIVDSTIDLIEELEERVTIVPLSVIFGEEEFLDKVTISKKEFYEKLVSSDVLPTTSQATPDAFMKEFEKAKESGENVLVITLSSNLSGTYQSACIAAEEYENVYVVDSGNTAIGSGILVESAFELLDKGESIENVVKTLEVEKEKIVIIALVDTLEYLKKGGRISKTVAFAGSVLNIKPVISIINGIINMIGKARGTKLGNKLMLEEIEKAGGVDFEKPFMLGFTGTSNELLLNFIEESKEYFENKLKEICYTSIGSTIGTHGGPGAIGVAFFKK